MILFDILKDANSTNGDCFFTEFSEDGSGQAKNISWGKFTQWGIGLYTPDLGQTPDPYVRVFNSQLNGICTGTGTGIGVDVICKISEITVNGQSIGDYSQFCKNFTSAHQL